MNCCGSEHFLSSKHFITFFTFVAVSTISTELNISLLNSFHPVAHQDLKWPTILEIKTLTSKKISEEVFQKSIANLTPVKYCPIPVFLYCSRLLLFTLNTFLPLDHNFLIIMTITLPMSLRDQRSATIVSLS